MTDSTPPSSASQEEKPAPGAPAPIVAYHSPRPGRIVLVGRYHSAMAATLPAAQLEAQGVPCEIFNANVNGLGTPYSGMSSVELYVHERDAVAAKEILLQSDEGMEPADDPDDALPAPLPWSCD